jgi:hypothetical protein
MSVVLRYVLDGSVYESFVGFTAADDLTADGLYTLITSILSEFDLDCKLLLIGQGYDGALVMSGRQKGVAA